MSPADLLAELSEDRATGRIAEIYDEIRSCSGVPYVSSLQRYVATLPGVLEWAWGALRPAMVSGAIPEAGWRLARAVQIPDLTPVPASALPELGIDAAGLAAIRNVAENFLRVSPVNLMTGSCLNLLLTGTRSHGAGFAPGWTPPAMLAPMPGNLDPEKLPPKQRDVLMRFATEVDGAPFVPALYRQLAHWPQFLLWLDGELGPRFDAPETNAARTAFRAAARQAAPEIVARLPALPPGASDASGAPDAETTRRVLATIDRYGETSPEMTMFGRLLLQALPEH